nr:putative ribonuclease H-like domain-containing protein [Tanacetum cinerariifolium]
KLSITPKPDLVFHDAPTASETVPTVLNVLPNTPKRNKDLSQLNRPSASIIEDWISDSEDESKGEPMPTQKAPSFVQTPRTSVKLVEHVVPTAVLTRSRLVPLNAARPVTTVVPQTNVKHQRPAKHVVNKPHSPIKRPINHRSPPKTSNFHEKVTNVKAKQGNPQQALKDKGVIDSGCSRHMTGNISYLSDFKEINGGYVAFGGNPKGGKITDNGKIRTGKLDFDDVYFVKELKFNLFNVSQLCDKKNSVLFIDTKFVARNQPNSSAGIQDNFDVGKVGKEPVSTQQYVLLPLWSTSSKDPQNKVHDAAFDDKEPEFEVHVSPSSSVKLKKHDEKEKREAKGKSHLEFTPVTTVGPNLTHNTNSFSAAGPSNIVVSPNFEIDDEEDAGAEAVFFNLETNITINPIPTTRVHKDHPVTQIIGDLSLAPQTRGFRNKKDERGIVVRNKAQLVSQGHTQEEGIYYDEVFAPVVRIEAIRLFLAYASFMGFMVYQMDVKSAFLYGAIEEEVYVCQPPGFEDPDYHDKVYKVVKALYGLHQAPRAWYKTLANYLLENGFQRGKIDQTLFIKKKKGDILLVHVYVYDIIFGSTNKELCKAFEKLRKDKFQMSSMGELAFFLRLQVKQKEDGIFISQDKYVAEILRKFGLTDGKSASTLIDTEKPLLKDPDGEDVDVHIYRSMNGSLMYLTSSRPDIMFVVCACACFQVTPKALHLHVVKRIFSNYAGASLDKKSIIGGCQFLNCRLISWQCKKQTVVATSSTEAEYIAAASCCVQVLWIQNQLLDYGTHSLDCVFLGLGLTMHVNKSSMKLLEWTLHVTNVLGAG